MDKYRIIEFEPKYTKQTISVIDTILKELGTIPRAEETIDDPDLQRINEIYVGKGKFWIALVNDKVVGTVAIRDLGNKTAKLNRMFLLTKHRGTGLGQELFNKAKKHAQKTGFEKIILNTHTTMQRAHKFYEKNGFKKTGINEDKFNYELKLN